MFKIFSWISLVCGCIGSVRNLYYYFAFIGDSRTRMQAKECLTFAIVLLAASLILFVFFRKLDKVEKRIDHLEARAYSLKARLEQVIDKVDEADQKSDKESAEKRQE